MIYMVQHASPSHDWISIAMLCALPIVIGVILWEARKTRKDIKDFKDGG